MTTDRDNRVILVTLAVKVDNQSSQTSPNNRVFLLLGITSKWTLLLCTLSHTEMQNIIMVVQLPIIAGGYSKGRSTKFQTNPINGSKKFDVGPKRSTFEGYIMQNRIK